MGDKPKVSALSLETGWMETLGGPTGGKSRVLPASYFPRIHPACSGNDFPPVAGMSDQHSILPMAGDQNGSQSPQKPQAWFSHSVAVWHEEKLVRGWLCLTTAQLLGEWRWVVRNAGHRPW